jgi:hypothetical protein
MHHKIIHALPFVPSRKRSKGFEINRAWGNWELNIKAWETLNYYDLITLLLISRAYAEGEYKDISKSNDDRRRVRVTLDLSKLVKDRGVMNKATNRRTMLKSLLRLQGVNLTFKTEGSTQTSWLFSDVKADDKNISIEIDANARFLELCIRNGVLINWKRLAGYGDDGVAIIFDAFLQGTKVKHGKGWVYRDWISEEEAFELIDPEGAQETKELRRQSQKAFELMHDAGLPEYAYDKVYKRWRREDFRILNTEL